VKAAIAVLISVILAGCASGPFFWTRADATPEAFNTDHAECAKVATIGYGVGSEKAYKACMSQKGWTRVRGRGGQPPDVPHFRGIEGDDEFATAPPPARPVADVKDLAGTWQGWLTTRSGQIRVLMVIQADGSYEASAGTALTRGNFYLESGTLRYRSTRSEGTAKLSQGRMSLTVTPERRFSLDTEETVYERVN
jgi:hypothetical protein